MRADARQHEITISMPSPHRHPVRTSAVIAIAIAAIAGFAASALAHDYSAGPLKIEHPWMRVPPAAAKVAGGFMKVTNTGTASDRLTGGSAAIAGRFEVHEMAVKDGVMSMRELKDGLEIKPGQTVELKPGSFHLMLIDLKGRPAVGESVKGTLVFEKAGKVDVEFKVEDAARKAAGHDQGSASAPGKPGKAGAGQHANH